MPIYEYYCPACEVTFEALVRIQGESPHCPKCDGADVAKQFSVPAAAQSSGSRSGNRPCDLPVAAPSCANPRCGGGYCAMQN